MTTSCPHTDHCATLSKPLNRNLQEESSYGATAGSAHTWCYWHQDS